MTGLAQVELDLSVAENTLQSAPTSDAGAVTA